MKDALSREQLAENLMRREKVPPEEIRNLLQQARKEKKSIFHLLQQKEILEEEEVIEFLSDQLALSINIVCPTWRVESHNEQERDTSGSHG